MDETFQSKWTQMESLMQVEPRSTKWKPMRNGTEATDNTFWCPTKMLFVGGTLCREEPLFGVPLKGNQRDRALTPQRPGLGQGVGHLQQLLGGGGRLFVCLPGHGSFSLSLFINIYIYTKMLLCHLQSQDQTLISLSPSLSLSLSFSGSFSPFWSV